MTKYQQTMQHYSTISADFFAEHVDERIALHHVDQSMKRNNPTRYAEWRAEDVVPITASAHCRVHHKGKPMTKSEKNKRAKNMKHSIAKAVAHRNMMIEITFPDCSVEYADSQRMAAKMLGCSRQQVYYVMSDLPQFEHYRRACSCKLKWVTVQEIADAGKGGYFHE